MRKLVLLLTIAGGLQLSAGTLSKNQKTSENPLLSMPLAEMFWNLYRQKNTLGKFDCSNKAGLYARALQKAGFKSEIIVIRTLSRNILHAVVKVKCKDGFRYLDPTKGIQSTDLKQLGNFQYTITYAELEKLGDDWR
ncbi:MAG: hypothetical protein HRT89_20950 [Lentisphaeria bacterium]|nr:hypothetical protein [Lentisphaeria bacterium]